MKTSTKWIIAGAALSLLAGGAYAADGMRKHGRENAMRMGQEMFKKADANSDGAISSDEMLQALNARFTEADADSNAEVSKAEFIAAVEKNVPYPRMKKHSGFVADRMVGQLDLDANGGVAKAEIENRAKKFFALADWNDDGKVEVAELQKLRPGHGRNMEGRGEGRGHGWGRRWFSGSDSE